MVYYYTEATDIYNHRFTHYPYLIYQL